MSNKILVFFSFLISLIIVELFLSLILFKNDDYNYKNRYLLYSEGKVFRNIDNFFTYYPNKKIKALNYYFDKDKFIEIYDYNIETNNLGLVQKNNVLKNKPSILLLGDSFTEGQGSKSWVDSFNGNFKGNQIINGGLLGTGFQQFELLDNYLSDFNITKVFVLFIGDDLRRNVFQFNKQEINCIENHLLCNGSEGFFGLPKDEAKKINFLDDLRKKQINNQKENKKTFRYFRRSIKTYLKNLHIIKIPLELLKNYFYKSKNVKIQKNFLAIDRLIKKYGNDISFINLKMKQEIIFMKKSYETIYVENYIKEKTKNYYNCNFNDDLKNFYSYDGHPNKRGYENLFNCVKKILTKEIDKI